MAAKELWCDKYSPVTLDGYVFRDAFQKTQIEKWIKEGSIPHLLLSGGPGVGKTTLAKILFNLLNIHPLDIKELNASRTNSVDDIRDIVINFTQMIPFGEYKVVLLDECLDENTTVSILKNNKEILIPIKDVDEENDLVKSYNVEKERIEWKPFKLFNKGFQETLEIEFENNETVICTPDHKWYVEDENGGILVITADKLVNYNHVMTVV